MIKQIDHPAWRSLDVHPDAHNGVRVISVAFVRDEKFYFDGVISALLGLNRIPHTIEISLDAEEMTCIARLNYADGRDDAAIYAPFEVESFALLWNEDPDQIHGLEGDRITLSLKPGELRYPIITGYGEIADLYLKEDRFVISPNEDVIQELEQAA